MRSLITSLLVLLLMVLASPAGRTEEPAAVVKVGGRYAVEVVRDVAYHDGPDADPAKHKLDLYRPKGRNACPVLFFVHGGAWRSGDKQLYGALGHTFARNGIVTVIISYRLSPQVRHPAHIQDVARAFAWTQRNIARYGGRADQIFAAGHSAGGHLVALLATDESYLKTEKLSPRDIKGVIALSGIYVIQPVRMLRSVFGEDADVCRRASPLTHVGRDHPPFLIVYAEKDFPTCDKMSEQFCEALQRSRVEARSLRVGDRDHISIIVFAAIDETDPVTQAMLEFIAKHSDLKLMPRMQ
jgi:acetyl esterase/lipase